MQIKYPFYDLIKTMTGYLRSTTAWRRLFREGPGSRPAGNACDGAPPEGPSLANRCPGTPPYCCRRNLRLNFLFQTQLNQQRCKTAEQMTASVSNPIKRPPFRLFAG